MPIIDLTGAKTEQGHVTSTTNTSDIFADTPPSSDSVASNEAVSESMFDKPKRERAKDTSPMAQAKLATTQLRVLDARKGRALQAQDKLLQEIESLDAKRDAFVLTLSEPVIAILKAGGVL